MREKYNFLIELDEAKCCTLFNKYKALESLVVRWVACLLKDSVHPGKPHAA
jgi:hypothetical protein